MLAEKWSCGKDGYCQFSSRLRCILHYPPGALLRGWKSHFWDIRRCSCSKISSAGNCSAAHTGSQKFWCQFGGAAATPTAAALVSIWRREFSTFQMWELHVPDVGIAHSRCGNEPCFCQRWTAERMLLLPCPRQGLSHNSKISAPLPSLPKAALPATPVPVLAEEIKHQNWDGTEESRSWWCFDNVGIVQLSKEIQWCWISNFGDTLGQSLQQRSKVLLRTRKPQKNEFFTCRKTPRREREDCWQAEPGTLPAQWHFWVITTP